jgi:YcaO-like protein with predicted kinase domain
MQQFDKPSEKDLTIQYLLEHQVTEYGTGQFTCMPREDLEFEDALEYVRDHPNDDFMHKYLLHLAGTFGLNLTHELIQRGKKENPHLTALMYEVCLINDRFRRLRSEFDGVDVKALAQHTPLMFINWSLQEETDAKVYWLRILSDNIMCHRLASDDSGTTFPALFDDAAIDTWMNEVVSVENLMGRPGEKQTHASNEAQPSPGETFAKAIERLMAIGLKVGPETENPACLSPCAVQIQWLLYVHTSTGRNHWELRGVQTSYGKGLNIDQARASCFMEVVERVSSFASFDSRRALHYKDDLHLIHASYKDVIKDARQALNPNDMHLEVPYENQPLYWVPAQRVDERGIHLTHVPAQLVFLFCNLDEISLTSGLPSTGLASGNTIEEAKLHALLEVIERDAERVMPYCEEKCFLLESQLGPVADVLQRARQEGIQVQFLDITTELGIPCYKAFVQGPGGQILKGCAAHLNGRKAAVSALLEMPFHASWFRPVPTPPGMRTVKEDTLPDYSSEHPARDLELLERTLIANGYRPIYVNLTREDVDIPVVKAIVPGLELFAELDTFSSLSLRQFAHYLKAWP